MFLLKILVWIVGFPVTLNGIAVKVVLIISEVRVIPVITAED